MTFKYVYVLPLLQGAAFLLGILVTYILAALVNRDVPPIFPYVSDTGAWSVERCIFSFMLGIGALLMFMTFYIRYRQVNEILETNKETEFKPILKTLNKTSLYLSFIGATGLFVLGCFQVQPFLIPHLIGSSTAFVLGWIILIIQTYISFKIYPILGSKALNIFRALICVVITVALFVCGIFGVLSYINFKGDDITQWTENSGGYEFHLVSVINEWILVFSMVLYLSLYTGEFKSVLLHKPKIKIINV